MSQLRNDSIQRSSIRARASIPESTYPSTAVVTHEFDRRELSIASSAAIRREMCAMDLNLLPPSFDKTM